jgi:hypothetical protein
MCTRGKGSGISLDIVACLDAVMAARHTRILRVAIGHHIVAHKFHPDTI